MRECAGDDNSGRANGAAFHSGTVALLPIVDASIDGSPSQRMTAEQLWPVVVATEWLAYRMLAACWSVERSGEPPPLDPAQANSTPCWQISPGQRFRSLSRRRSAPLRIFLLPTSRWCTTHSSGRSPLGAEATRLYRATTGLTRLGTYSDADMNIDVFTVGATNESVADFEGLTPHD